MGIAELPPSGGQAAKEIVKHADLLAIGMPEYLAKWILAQQAKPEGRAYVERAARFVAFWRRDLGGAPALVSAWSRLARAAKDETALILLFANLPDVLDPQPNAYLVGFRSVDAAEERRRYRQTRKSIIWIQKQIDLLKIDELSADCFESSPAAQLAYADLSDRIPMLSDGLVALDRVLALVDAKAKNLTAQHAAEKRPEYIYRRRVALLNGYLKRNCHADLCIVAAVNFPALPLKRHSVAQSLKRALQAQS